jgi:hypothetical protein
VERVMPPGVDGAGPDPRGPAVMLFTDTGPCAPAGKKSGAERARPPVAPAGLKTPASVGSNLGRLPWPSNPWRRRMAPGKRRPWEDNAAGALYRKTGIRGQTPWAAPLRFRGRPSGRRSALRRWPNTASTAGAGSSFPPPRPIQPGIADPSPEATPGSRSGLGGGPRELGRRQRQGRNSLDATTRMRPGTAVVRRQRCLLRA